MRPTLLLAGALLSLAFAPPAAGELSWLTLDQALERARAERNVVLVDLRGCPPEKEGEKKSRGKCASLNTVELMRAGASPAFHKAYGAYIRARVDAGTETSESAGRLIAQNPPFPSFVIVDPAATVIASWRLEDASIHLNNLNLARRHTKEMIRAYDVRTRGDGSEADLILGDINLEMGHAYRALRTYERAAAAFEAAGNPDRALAAKIRIENVNHLLGRQRPAIVEAERLLRNASPSVSAEGHLILGAMYARDKSQALAVDAYQRSRELAPAGSAISLAARRGLLRLGETVEAPATAGTASVKIVGSTRTTISGQAEFSAMAPEATARILWYVDGKHVATASKPPFKALIRFGDTPRAYLLRAVAFDGNGKGIARATLVLNDRLDQPRIAIAAPVETTVSGPVMMEAEAYVPPTMALDSVQFFWNGEEIHRFSEPPFRSEFVAPASFGYFRAVLTLKDGQTAEDAQVLNSAGFGETMDVHTIAFAATVFDPSGRHVTTLRPGDFAAFDQNLPVNLKVRDPGAEPGTVGVAIDVSGSMSALLLREIEIASQLIDVIAPSERMFLTAFDTQPRLLQPATRDARVLRDELVDLFAEGSTAVADAFAFALQQFTGLSGRRALVLITDGHENASEQSTRECMNLARQSGVPLYVIVPRGAAQGSDAFRRVLKEMAEVTGGLLFSEPSPEQVPAILTRIRDDVRAQYLLAFDATGTSGPGTWRKVRVQIPGKRATVRTIGGYYTR